MGLHPQRQDMVEVELVEDEPYDAAPLAAGAGADGGPAAHGGDHRTGRHVVTGGGAVGLSRRVLAGAAVVIVVVTGSVVAAVRAEPLPVGALVGGAPSLVSPLAEVWRVEAPREWSVAAGLLLTTSHEPEGLSVVATDMTTGDERWTLAPIPGSGGISCPFAVGDEWGPLVVCQSLGPLQQSHEHAHGLVQEPGRLLLVAAGDGRIADEILLDPRHLGFAAIGEDLLLADLAFDPSVARGATRSAVVHLERRDLRSGDSVWTTEVAVDHHPASAPPELTVEGALVVLRGLTTAVLDAQDGRTVRTMGGSAEPGLPGDLPVLTTWPHGFAVRPDTARWPTPTQWFALDGTPLSSFDGAVAEPAVNDGSEAEIVLTTTAGGGSLRGIDAIGGQPLWSIDLELGEPVVRLDGAVVVSGLDTLRSVDLLTGKELWRSSADALHDPQTVSDGSFVLVVGDALGVGRSVSAVSLSDGSLLWRSPMPKGTRTVEVADRRIVAVGPGVVVGLG